MDKTSLLNRMRSKWPLPDYLLRAPYPLPEITPETIAFHNRTIVADLHSDPMLKNLDLNVHQRRGHIDFPRLIKGGVNLSVFAVPTGGPPFDAAFTYFCRFNRWPRYALKDFLTMADFQLDIACRAIDASNGKAFSVRSFADIDQNPSPGRVGIILAIEGGQPLLGKVENLDRFYQKGIRVMSLTHFLKNDLAGSSYHKDERNRGVSPFGRDILLRMQELGMIVDLAHASRATFDDVLKITTGPVMVSHTGVAGVHPLWRNIDDDQVQAVANRNGVIGIIYEALFLGSRSLDRVIDHMEHVITVAGEDVVALGSDWDGCLFLPHGIKSAADLPILTQRMFDRGWPEKTVAKVLGENFVRMTSRIKPQ